MTVREYREISRRRKKVRVQKTSAMTKPEWAYQHGVLGGIGAYEGEELRITPEGVEKHVYTPDFVTSEEVRVKSDEVVDFKVYHEVKGTYRLGSQDGARLRWCFAAVAHPEAWFVWSKMRKDGMWDVEIWRDGGRVREKARGVIGFRFGKEGETLWRRK